MSRIALNLNEQIQCLQAIQQQCGLNQVQMARLCQRHSRTFSDWMRGKCRMRYESLQQLIERTGVAIDKPIGKIQEFSHVHAAARLGALRRNRLHGNPGTPEGRRKGGMTSIARRLAAGLQAVPDGFVLPKVIRRPDHSTELAEFIGMMLGDGCLSSAFQVALYFNTETDAAYADFMEQLAHTLFEIKPHRTNVSPRGGALIFSSKRFVDHLMHLGFHRGDKVMNQAGVPPWIVAQMDYRRSCLRGLMDTDGSVYRYEHTVYSRRYTHIALCFTNRSHPLLRFVKETLSTNGYHPTTTGFKVYLYRRAEVTRYFSEIGTHNAKHLGRYQLFAQRRKFKEKTTSQVHRYAGEVAELVESAGPENP